MPHRFRSALAARARPAAVRQAATVEETALLDDVKRGNHAAALTLLERYRRFLWMQIYRSRLLDTADDHDDLYSIAVLTLLEAAHNYAPGPASFTTYLSWQLYAAISRERRHRDRNVHYHRSFLPEEADVLPGRELPPTIDELPPAFWALPPQTQQALSMRFGLNGEAERSGEEIGRLLGTSRWAVWQRCQRGLAALRRAINHGA